MNRRLLRQARLRLFIEKTGVEVMVLALLAAVFVLAGPLLRRMDPGSALAFLPAGEWGRMLIVIVALWLLAALCGGVMVFARPDGALAATLLGLAGVSLSSAPMRTLLWRHQDHLPTFYVLLIVELVCSGAAMVVAAMIVEIAGRLTRPLAGRWAWRRSWVTEDVGVSETANGDAATLRELPLYDVSPTLATLVWAGRGLVGQGCGHRNATAGRQGASGLKRRAACLGLMLAVAVVLLAVLMQTTERYQVLFALVVSFFLGALIAHQVFPTACGILMWISPVLLGVVVYALGAFAAAPSGLTPMGWLDVPRLARALPIDWIAAGGGGAAAGYWLSTRMHEAKALESRIESL